MRIPQITLAIALILACHVSFAHKTKPSVGIKASADASWTRRVSRVIDLTDTTDLTRRKLRSEDDETSLTEMLVKLVKEGKIKAYSNTDTKFAIMLTVAQMMAIFNPANDTVVMEDPITSTTVTKVIHRDFNFEQITKYRILEEWTYNRLTGNTSVQIIGLAPVKDVYSDMGEYRGSQSVVWFRYNDIQNVLKKYEDMHPTKNISLGIWNDYFSEEKK